MLKVAPLLTFHLTVSSDEPPRRRRRRTEITQVGVVDRSTKDGPGSLPGAMEPHLHQGNHIHAGAGNLKSGARVEAGRPAHQGPNEVGPQDTRLVDRQQRDTNQNGLAEQILTVVFHTNLGPISYGQTADERKSRLE